MSPEHCLRDEGQFPSPPGTSHELTFFLIWQSCCGGNPKPLPHDMKLERVKGGRNLYFMEQGFSEPGASPQNYFELVGAPDPEQSSKQDMAGWGCSAPLWGAVSLPGHLQPGQPSARAPQKLRVGREQGQDTSRLLVRHFERQFAASVAGGDSPAPRSEENSGQGIRGGKQSRGARRGV